MKKICPLCTQDREYTANTPFCDGCTNYIKLKNELNKPFLWHELMFHHKIGMAKCRKYGYLAFYHHGSKSSVYIDVRKIMDNYSLDFIPYLVHAISHELFHLLLMEEHGDLYCTLLDGTYLRKMLMPYLGGSEIGIGFHAKEIDKLNDKINRRIKEGHK